MLNIPLYKASTWLLQADVMFVMDSFCISFIFDPGRHVNMLLDVSSVGLKVDSPKIFKK